MQVFCQHGAWRVCLRAARRYGSDVKNPPLKPLRKLYGSKVSKSYRAVLLGLWLLLSRTPLYANAPAPPDGGSGARFVSPFVFSEHNYLLVGSGVAKKQAVVDYTMALYVDESAKPAFIGLWERAGRRRAGLWIESRAQNFYSWGHFSKLGVLRYAHPISPEELQKFFREGMSELFGPQGSAEMRRDALAFIALFDSGLAEAQELRIHSDDVGHLDIYLDGKKKAGPQNAKLCRHVWDIWLGYHPAVKELRQGLLEHLDILAK